MLIGGVHRPVLLFSLTEISDYHLGLNCNISLTPLFHSKKGSVFKSWMQLLVRPFFRSVCIYFKYFYVFSMGSLADLLLKFKSLHVNPEKIVGVNVKTCMLVLVHFQCIDS